MIEVITKSTEEESAELFFNLLYSIYSLPNIVLPLLGGLFIDTFGCSKALILFTSCIAFG
jgi:hypothetical protein